MSERETTTQLLTDIVMKFEVMSKRIDLIHERIDLVQKRIDLVSQRLDLVSGISKP